MAIDPSKFNKLNVADTCAVWNCLSSPVLFEAAIAAGCSICMVAFVEYECLLKPRKKVLNEDVECQARLRRELGSKRITRWEISISDLDEVASLEARKRLGKGELASIAFAKRNRQAFLTDDMKARKLAQEVLGAECVQTTPHLLAWLLFNGHLSDQDKTRIVADHEALNRPLAPHFEEAYREALRCRLMAHSSKAPESADHQE